MKCIFQKCIIKREARHFYWRSTRVLRVIRQNFTKNLLINLGDKPLVITCNTFFHPHEPSWWNTQVQTVIQNESQGMLWAGDILFIEFSEIFWGICCKIWLLTLCTAGILGVPWRSMAPILFNFMLIFFADIVHEFPFWTIS